MKFEILKNENSEATLKVTVENATFLQAEKKAYDKNKSRFTIPGFRKGKAPLNIIKKQYGEGVFFEDAVNTLLPEYYEKALDELSIDPVSRPEIDVLEVGADKDFVFTATVAVIPEFTLEGYKGIEVEKVDADVSDEMVDQEIEKTRESNARLIQITDSPVEEGDTTIIDYKGFVGDEAFEGGTAEGQELVIGSKRFIPGFEEQLIGKNLGDDVDVKVTFPEEYHSEELAGKEAVFKVKIHEIKRKELPALDDEFAKDVSEFDTLEAYKASIKEELEVSVKESANAAQRDKVIEAVAALIDVEFSPKMIEAEVDGMVNDFDQQLQQQGLSLDKYMQFTGGNLDALKEQMRPDALMRIKTSMVIDKVKEQENIEVTDEDVENELAKIAEMQKRDVADLRKIFENDNYEYLKSNLKSRKAVDFLVAEAKLV